MSDNEEAAAAAATSGKDKRRASKDVLAEIPTETSPGEAYVVFIEMNTLSNKLKLLNYEDEYLLKWKMKPISKLGNFLFYSLKMHIESSFTLFLFSKDTTSQ
jgi:hypothetical protein